MQIAELLTLNDVQRRAALDRNAAELRSRIRRQDAACYIEDMLTDLCSLAREAGLPRVAASLNRSRKEMHELVSRGAIAKAM